MKIATWNTNSLRVRVDHLRKWANIADPDVICLQETKTVDAQFPSEAIHEMGYIHQAIYGQKTYNGVAILSKTPLQDVHKGFKEGESDPQCRLIRATTRGIRILNCYVPNGNRVDSDKFRYKLSWLKRLRKELDSDVLPTEPVLVCGDINIAPSDDDTWDPFEADGHILFHPKEHRALKRVVDWGLQDAFRVLNPRSQAFSWWDYRAGGFRKNHGFRIDHIYLTPSLMERCTAVEIHRDVRGWEQPSDHVPVVVTLNQGGAK
jgi:exodeoxyribonuclease-3